MINRTNELEHQILKLLEEAGRWMDIYEIEEIMNFEDTATPREIYTYKVRDAAKMLAKAGKINHHVPNGRDHYHHKKTRPRF